MRSLLRTLVGVTALAAAALAVSPARAAITSLTVFGDSLSDTGNIFLASGGAFAGPPYFNGRFSNGPIWIDHLAGGLGQPAAAVPSLAGGTNYAFGGARTGTSTTPPGLLAQYGGLWAPANLGVADPNGLYVVVGGGNDLRDARSAFTGNSAADQAGRQAAAAAAAQNISTIVGGLASQGARRVLIATAPDLGATPEAAALGLVAASSDASARYNALVLGIEATLESVFVGLDVITLDMAALAANIRFDALNNGGATYGITNVLTPCTPFQGNIGISCSVSLFSDALHPSARAHALLGDAALATLRMNGVIPEPATLLLSALALVALAATRRRTSAS